MIKNEEKLIKYHVKKLEEEQKINVTKTIEKMGFAKIKVEINNLENKNKTKLQIQEQTL